LAGLSSSDAATVTLWMPAGIVPTGYEVWGVPHGNGDVPQWLIFPGAQIIPAVLDPATGKEILPAKVVLHLEPNARGDAPTLLLGTTLLEFWGGPVLPAARVATVASAMNGQTVELIASAGTLTNVSAQGQSGLVVGIFPFRYSFPFGQFQFTLQGVPAPGSATVEMVLPAPLSFLPLLPGGPTMYIKTGPTPADPSSHAYQFLFQHQTDADSAAMTGAEYLDPTHLLLHFVDGQRGDDDLSGSNGIIVDSGGPAVRVQAPPDPCTAYVTALYSTVLGRQPDAPGLAVWLSALEAGASRWAVAAAFWTSPEHRGIEVDGYYATFLHRAADPAGRAAWVNALLDGTSELTVEYLFLTSPEYIAAHADAAAFVDGLYGDLFRRAVDPAGQGWVALADSAFGRSRVAMDLLLSNEMNRRTIDSLYSSLLDRAADPLGERDALTLLQSHAAVQDALAETLLASPEFLTDGLL
jgi:hypothetical protein